MTIGSDAARLIDERLRAAGTPERAENEKRYLKSDLEFYGVTMPASRAITLGVWRELDGNSHDTLIEAVETLWATGVHEARAAAVELLEHEVTRLGDLDVPLLERLLRESKTWALVDGLAASVVGPLDERVGIGATLERWAVDDDFWIRRSALLAHLLGLRTGKGSLDRFLRFADTMLDEKEFFIRRGHIDRVAPGSSVAWTRPGDT